MSNVELEWATPNADKMIARIARVSAPANQDNESIEGLLNYCMREGHVSPFEMANVCLEITTTRDIARQILRHRSFSFQEFSQRYAEVGVLPEAELRDARMQDTKNRQNSIENADTDLQAWWHDEQEWLLNAAQVSYAEALAKGIAKEVARAVLPEGLTTSRMYMNGTLRSWIHYLKSRLDSSTQKEHRLLAQQALEKLREVAPVTIGAFFPIAGDKAVVVPVVAPKTPWGQDVEWYSAMKARILENTGGKPDEPPRPSPFKPVLVPA